MANSNFKNATTLFSLMLVFSAYSYADCSKEEVLRYIKEGLGKEEIKLVCNASEESNSSISDQMCCCIIITEEKNKTKTYSTTKMDVQKEWNSTGDEDRKILPANECGETQYIDSYARTRSFCKKTSDCTGN